MHRPRKRLQLRPSSKPRKPLSSPPLGSNTRLKDQALRVEVIDREEIEEKALMTPGSVAMLLGETSGLRVQTTAPSLGAANVRIQGLRGRYAQLIADGLPLYGAQGDSFSLLQVPPLDLGQVEIIKGVASALYGASALGGVINLVSRRPREPERELLVNRTSQEGTDVTVLARTANLRPLVVDAPGRLPRAGGRISTTTAGRTSRRSTAACCGRASFSRQRRRQEHVRDVWHHGGRSRWGHGTARDTAERYAVHGVVENPPCRWRLRWPLARSRQARVVGSGGAGTRGNLRIGSSELHPRVRRAQHMAR